MTARVLDGRRLAARILAGARRETARLKKACGVTPSLAIVFAGRDPASAVYVAAKERACRRNGLHCRVHRFPGPVSQRALCAAIQRLNRDPSVHGVLVQLPLPSQLDTLAVLNTVSPAKDVDGLTYESQGRLLEGRPRFCSATARAVLRILASARTPLKGRHAVLVGHSLLVGKPLALLLLARNATVTVCHKHTRRLAAHTRRADVLVTATGVPGLITGRHVKKGAVVVDVGIAKKGGHIVGDVAFSSVARKAAAVTPVPGGVGPVTVACLVAATVDAARAAAEAGEAVS